MDVATSTRPVSCEEESRIERFANKESMRLGRGSVVRRKRDRVSIDGPTSDKVDGRCERNVPKM